jgi:DNA-directed RNA polymerase subunit H (RpoH/RPB5)
LLTQISKFANYKIEKMQIDHSRFCTLYASIEKHVPIPEYDIDDEEEEEVETHIERTQFMKIKSPAQLPVSSTKITREPRRIVETEDEEDKYESVLIDYKRPWIETAKPVAETLKEKEKDLITLVPSQETQVSSDNEEIPNNNTTNHHMDAVSVCVQETCEFESEEMKRRNSKPLKIIRTETSTVPRKLNRITRVDDIDDDPEYNDLIRSPSSWQSIKRKPSTKAEDWMDSSYNKSNKKLKQLTLVNVKK